MGRKSTFSQLPDELTQRFHELLQSDKYTQHEIVAYLNDYLEKLGEQPVITRDIVQKQSKNYKERMAVAIDKKRRERELISGYMEVFNNEPNTDNVQLISLIIESAAAKLAIDGDEDDSLTVKDIHALAKTNKLFIESKKITEDIIKKAQEVAAKRVAEAAREAGVDEETITVIKRVIVDVKDRNGDGNG